MRGGEDDDTGTGRAPGAAGHGGGLPEEEYMNSVTISAVGGGTGHAYAFREADRVDATIGKWQKETPGAATPRAVK